MTVHLRNLLCKMVLIGLLATGYSFAQAERMSKGTEGLIYTAVERVRTDAYGAKARVSIVSPREKQTVHSNRGQVPVSVKVENGESLRHSNLVRVILDGKQFGPLRHTHSFQLENVVRGEHQLQIQFVNESGEIVASSDPVTFYMWQSSRLF